MLWVLIHALPYSVFADGSIDFKYYKPSEQIKADAVERALRTSKYAACECLKEFCIYDLRDRVSSINVPTLIIVGEKDTSTPINLSRYLRKQIEGSKLAIIPDSKHMPMIDRADLVNEVIAEFIRED
jgi:pimeloyl-ACP methyl ester carboxylesterase